MTPYPGGDGHSYTPYELEEEPIRDTELEFIETMKPGGLAVLVSLGIGIPIFSGIWAYYYVKAYGIDQTFENIKNLF